MHHTLLQTMDLVRLQDNHWSLTLRGHNAVSLISIFKCDTAVMCAYAEGLGTKFSRCVRRLALI